MESANHHVLESLALNLSPVFHLVARNVLRVASYVVGSICVRTLRSDGSHQLVVFVGNEVSSRHLRDAVNLVIFLFAQVGVGDEPVLFVSSLNLVQQGTLSFRVVGAELVCTFEHEVFQVVG